MALLGELWTAWKFKRTTLGRALDEHTREFFYSGHTLSWLRQDNKEKHVRALYDLLGRIDRAENPPMQLRTALADYVILYAQMAVLSLTEEEKAGHFFAANPYITGEIHRRIVEAAPHVEEAAQFAWQTEGASAEDLMGFANARGALMLFYANALNMVRIEGGDTDPVKDWYKPFVEAMLVWEEDTLRDRLGMPRLVPGALHGLPYSTFLNQVTNGEANPFYSWTKAFPDLYLAGEGPL